MVMGGLTINELHEILNIKGDTFWKIHLYKVH